MTPLEVSCPASPAREGLWLGELTSLGPQACRSPGDPTAGSREGAATPRLRGWVLSRNGHTGELGLGSREEEGSDGDLDGQRLELRAPGLCPWQSCRCQRHGRAGGRARTAGESTVSFPQHSGWGGGGSVSPAELALKALGSAPACLGGLGRQGLAHGAALPSCFPAGHQPTGLGGVRQLDRQEDRGA